MMTVISDLKRGIRSWRISDKDFKNMNTTSFSNHVVFETVLRHPKKLERCFFLGFAATENF